MSYRNLLISSEAVLQIKDDQLLIETTEDLTEDKIIRAIKLDQINTVVLENQSITMELSVLTALTYYGASIVLADDFGFPISTILPYKLHCQKPVLLTKQLNINKTMIKQIWQDLVSQRIYNQAEVMRILGAKKWMNVRKLSKNVKSGDTADARGRADREYMPAVTYTLCDNLQAVKTRAQTMLRGHLCRSLYLKGLYPEIGIRDGLGDNPFALSEELSVVFEPFVELYLLQNQTLYQAGLTDEAKFKLVDMTKELVGVDEEARPLADAIDILIDSLVETLESGTVNLSFFSLSPS